MTGIQCEAVVSRMMWKMPAQAFRRNAASLNGRPVGSARCLRWQLRPELHAWHEARADAYLLRTNLTVTDPATLWTRYVQLIELEAAFRAFKSELAIRPIWHQKAPCVQAHILVPFLGNALWVRLKHTLRAAGTNLSPVEALHQLRGIKNGDILLEHR